MRAQKGPLAPPTTRQVAAALEHEFRVAPIGGFENISADIPMRFEIKGPLVVTSSTDLQGFDDPTIKVEMGPDLHLHMDWDAAEATLFSILVQLYGPEWARLVMALCARSPVPTSDLDDRVPPEVAQALWKAAWGWRKQWPQRRGGFDDHIWGVCPPVGVKPQHPIEEHP